MVAASSSQPRIAARVGRWATWSLVASLLLGGCATTGTLDSEVTSFSQWPAERRITTFSFERLPSQQADGERQQQLETAARPAFLRAGFREVAPSAKPDVTVQVGLRTSRDAQPEFWDDPFFFPGPWPYARHGRGAWGGWGYPPMMSYRSPRYDHAVLVLLRDAASGKPLYETHASFMSYGGLDLDTLAALFDAAMKDFPQPAISPRQVRVPRGTPAPSRGGEPVPAAEPASAARP